MDNTAKNIGVNNLLLNFGGVTRPRKVIPAEHISSKDQEGIVKLYEALVSRQNIKRIDVSKVRKHFPTFEDIDINMIIKEAFPAFERTIGVENFAKVKKYFGIGVKQNSKSIKSKDIELLVANLRTIENAQYYICGFKELISKMAKKLENAPENLTELEKAKIIRMYFVIYFGYYYFVEDYSAIPGNSDELQVNYAKAHENNKYGFYPEELFSLYIAKVNSFDDESVFYDIIFFDISDLEKKDKRLFKEVMKFAELTFSNEEFDSVNKVIPNQTFADVRKIKNSLHREPGMFPLEIFAEKEIVNKLNLIDFYTIFKLLKTRELEGFERVECELKLIEGSRTVTKTHLCYQVVPGLHVAGPAEKARFIRLMEYVAGRGLTMAINTKANGEPRKRLKKYNMRQFINAIQFANDADYLTSETDVKTDFKVATLLIKMDKNKDLMEYSREDENAVENMKSSLGIDKQFEFEFLRVKKPVVLEDVVARFALKNGYVESVEQIDTSLIQEVIIPGNEKLLEEYDEGKIKDAKLKKKIGFSEEFSKMFFRLQEINVSAIEDKLLEVKKTTLVGKKIDDDLKLLVLLYCYIIEKQIPCGLKNRVPKRNKTLKPSNLRKIIE